MKTLTQKMTIAAVVILANLMILTPFAIAQNYEVLTAPTNLNVNPDSTVSYSFGEQFYVKNLIIQAEGVGRDSTIEVMVNGDVKGTLYAPGRDPSYVVTVEDKTSSIEFRHRGGASMRVSAIVATVIANGQAKPQPPRTDPRRTAESLADRVVQLMIDIVPYSSLDEEAKYLVPIKIAAGKMRAMVIAHGFHSQQTRTAMLALQDKIESADAYLLILMESEALFDQIVEVYSIKETIKDLLN